MNRLGEPLNRLVTNEVPSTCNIPTGLGKTSVLPPWFLALVSKVESSNLGSPRRLIYIANRRPGSKGACQTPEAGGEAVPRADAPADTAASAELASPGGSGNGQSLLTDLDDVESSPGAASCNLHGTDLYAADDAETDQPPADDESETSNVAAKTRSVASLPVRSPRQATPSAWSDSTSKSGCAARVIASSPAEEHGEAVEVIGGGVRGMS